MRRYLSACGSRCALFQREYGDSRSIAAALQNKGLVVRKPSAEDKRSIVLCLTGEGEKFLERDPINVLRDQVEALEAGDRSRLHDTLGRILTGLDVAKRRHRADVCGR